MDIGILLHDIPFCDRLLTELMGSFIANRKFVLSRTYLTDPLNRDHFQTVQTFDPLLLRPWKFPIFPESWIGYRTRQQIRQVDNKIAIKRISIPLMLHLSLYFSYHLFLMQPLHLLAFY